MDATELQNVTVLDAEQQARAACALIAHHALNFEPDAGAVVVVANWIYDGEDNDDPDPDDPDPQAERELIAPLNGATRTLRPADDQDLLLQPN